MSLIQKKRNNRRQTRKRNSLKDLTHKQISDAMDYYLEHGGKITKIESTERSFSEFMASGSGNDDTDTFLNGGAA